MALGQLRSDNAYMQHGNALYCMTLRRINLVLQTYEKANRCSLLACCRFAIFFEVLRGNGPSRQTQAHDWQKHVVGMIGLALQDPSDPDEDELSRLLRQEVRHLAARMTITRREPCSLSQASWSRVRVGEMQNDMEDSLLDLMLSLSVLLQRHDLYLTDLEQADPAREDLLSSLQSSGRSLLDDCVKYSRAMLVWEKRAGTIFTGRAMYPTVESRAPIDNIAPFDMDRLPGFQAFLLVQCYWATSVLHYAQLRVAHARMVLSFPGQIPTLPGAMDPKPYAQNIHRWAGKFFDPSAGLFGPEKSTFIVGAAMYYYVAIYGGYSAEAKELASLYGTGKKASMMMGFLKSMAANKAAAGMKGDTGVPTDRQSMARSWFRLRAVPSGSNSNHIGGSQVSSANATLE